MQNSPARIGLNAHLLSLSQTYRGAGISWYIYNLLKNLAHVSPEYFRYDAFLYDRTYKEKTRGLNLHFSQLPTKTPVIRIFWEQFIQPLALKRARVDMLHALAFVAPIVVPCPFVVTVYDLSFYRYPEAFRPFNRWYLTRFTATTVNRAKAVITISESTRQDVIKFLQVPPARVHTIYCGSDDSFRPLPQPEVEAFRAAQQLPGRFILYLGTLEPRKNVDGLIKAYARWRKRNPKAPLLVVAGGKGWYYQEIFRLVKSLNLTDSVHFPGYVPQETLALWYNAATIFVYPSHFEGFGLPVLEAMACGTPVITSTASALPEVAGVDGTARLVAPANTNALADALAEVSNQRALREQMSQRGILRAAQFRWDKTARETVSVYKTVLENKA